MMALGGFGSYHFGKKAEKTRQQETQNSFDKLLTQNQELNDQFVRWRRSMNSRLWNQLSATCSFSVSKSFHLAFPTRVSPLRSHMKHGLPPLRNSTQHS